jgi:hypothetical protein
MKKLLYILLITFVSGFALTSCTEEEVAPATASGSGAGGGGSDPI